MRLGVLLAGLVVLAIVAFGDLHHTRAVSARASSDSWWCMHEAVRCTRFDESAYHARWELREHGYELGGGALAGLILFAGGRRLRLRS